MKKIKPEHLAVLKRIQNSIPKEWTDKVVKTEPLAPVVQEVCERGLKDPDVSDELKKKLQMIVDSGMLTKKVGVSDHKIEAKIDAFVDEEIKKAIRRGELPNNLKKNGNKR